MAIDLWEKCKSGNTGENGFRDPVTCFGTLERYGRVRGKFLEKVHSSSGVFEVLRRSGADI
jgi:hypothetical protein